MRILLLIFALCYSFETMAKLNHVGQEFLLDDTEALEYGFPYEVVITSIELIPDLFNPQVKVIGSANEQEFELTRKVMRIGPFENGQYSVKTIVWQDSVTGENCEEEIHKDIALNFKVDRASGETAEYEVKGTYLYSSDSCHSPVQIKEFAYSLMKDFF